ncbi:hypothetical protein BS78_06G145400 [Paspalum vaginatum]|nr:hypothetical protein BS78_06G145400 [Paspalum vaginatum]
MRFLFWSVKGMGKASRKGQVKEYIAQNNLYMVGLQETKREDFQDNENELRELSVNKPFTWRWSPAKGTSGGILVGIRDDFFELEMCEVHDLYVWIGLRHRISNFRFYVVTVYGPAHHELSRYFLQSLSEIINKGSCLPILFGGDFNLIRETKDKNNENLDKGLMDAFNEFIGVNSLREIKRSGSRFSWTNKQLDPVLVNLILVSIEWEERFPLCMSWTMTRVRSDHNPVVFESGELGEKALLVLL